MRLPAIVLLGLFAGSVFAEAVDYSLPDINARELLAVVPLLGASLFLGLYPSPVLDRTEPSVTIVSKYSSPSATSSRVQLTV